jgi:gluconolactonase
MAVHTLSRRALIAGTAGMAGAATLSHTVPAQTPAPTPTAQIGTPPSTITNPPRDWSPGHPSIYPDPDVIVIDTSFRQFAPGNAPVRRLWTGAQWAEGPAWSSQGQYLVFSDVTGNTQYRYLWDAGQVVAFRRPSNNTNGSNAARMACAPMCSAICGSVRTRRSATLGCCALPRKES